MYTHLCTFATQHFYKPGLPQNSFFLDQGPSACYTVGLAPRFHLSCFLPPLRALCFQNPSFVLAVFELRWASTLKV